MHSTTRRHFLTHVAAAGATGLLLGGAPQKTKRKRRMTIDLCCGRIGVRADQQQREEAQAAARLLQQVGRQAEPAAPRGGLARLAAKDLVHRTPLSV